MKRNIIILFLLFSVSALGQQIKWMSLSEALEAQKEVPKKIFMDVYTHWCGPCKLLDKNTFTNPDLIRYVSENYYAVKFNAEGDEEIKFYDRTFRNPNYDKNKKGRNATHEFTQFLAIKGYPAMIFLSEDGDPIIPILGYHTAQQLEPYLKMIKQGDYMVFQKPDDLKNYLKNYIPRFRARRK